MSLLDCLPGYRDLAKRHEAYKNYAQRYIDENAVLTERIERIVKERDDARLALEGSVSLEAFNVAEKEIEKRIDEIESLKVQVAVLVDKLNAQNKEKGNVDEAKDTVPNTKASRVVRNARQRSSTARKE